MSLEEARSGSHPPCHLHGPVLNTSQDFRTLSEVSEVSTVSTVRRGVLYFDVTRGESRLALGCADRHLGRAQGTGPRDRAQKTQRSSESRAKQSQAEQGRAENHIRHHTLCGETEGPCAVLCMCTVLALLQKSRVDS